MAYWQSGLVVNALFLGLMLVLAAVLRRLVPVLGRIGLPVSMLAGVIGLALGPQVAGLIPFDISALESIIYHALALLCIAVGLQKSADQGGRRDGTLTVGFAIPFFAGLQGFIGLVLVLLFTAPSGGPLHPGFGLMLPLGFSQGAGQALAMGSAWEQMGMPDGPQVGLIFAAVGLAWSVLLGVPLVAWGKRSGAWKPVVADDAGGTAEETVLVVDNDPGALDPLTVHVAVVALTYLLVYAVLKVGSSALAGKPQIAAMIWGFHFIVAIGLSVVVRSVLTRVSGSYPLNNALLGRVSGIIVDVGATAGLAAVSIAVLRENWLPILLITSIGGTITMLGAVWIGRRAFPDAPFEHTVVLFGTATGTLTTGLALLRILDPGLRGPTTANFVMGSVVAAALGAPILVGLLPLPVAGFPGNYPGMVWIAIGLTALYLVLLVLGWRFLGPLRFVGRMTRAWPEDPHPRTHGG